jgi:hypothetical protein
MSDSNSRRRFLLGTAGVAATPLVAGTSGCASGERAAVARRAASPAPVLAQTGVEAPMP